MRLIQAILERNTEQGMVKTTTLLPNNPSIQIGSIISLDKEETKWKVTSLSEDTTPGRFDPPGLYVDDYEWSLGEIIASAPNN